MQKVIQGLAEEGRTMIMVTHEMGFARKVSNQLLFLHQGLVAEQGGQKFWTTPEASVCSNFCPMD